MPSTGQIRSWLIQHRSSARISFVLQIGTRLLSSLFNLLWVRLLVNAMGPALNGVFINFQSVTAFAGLGDLGIGGAVALKTSELIAQRNEAQLQRFLAVARLVFVTLALAGTIGFIILSPHLAGWLRFPVLPGVGSYTSLFVVGGIAFGVLIFSLYAINVNYGAANVLWPILPTFLLLQLSLAAHWLLARAGSPLWIQYLPYLLSLVISLILSMVYLRWSHPLLSELLPLRFDWPIVRSLIVNSVWLYFASIANVIYLTVARLFVMPLFGAALVPVYQYNYRLCELASMIISAAAFVGLPKIALLMMSNVSAERHRAGVELQRLSAFQTGLSSAAAIFYLAINSTFVAWWLPALSPAPLLWQTAFAINLVVAAGGEAAIHGALRCGDRGVRFGGLTFALSAGVNVISCLAFVQAGWANGIPWASPIAQTVLSLTAARFISRQLGVPWHRWVLRTWLLPLVVVTLAATIRFYLAPDSVLHATMLGGVYMILAIAALKSAGLSLMEMRQEWRRMTSLIGLRRRP